MTREEYVTEYIAKKHLQEMREVINEVLGDDLSINEIGIIEESLIESKMIAELCLSNCEECDRYCTSKCIKVIIGRFDYGLHGDDWCDGINNIDDCLEMKRCR